MDQQVLFGELVLTKVLVGINTHNRKTLRKILIDTYKVCKQNLLGTVVLMINIASFQMVIGKLKPQIIIYIDNLNQLFTILLIPVTLMNIGHGVAKVIVKL